MIIIKNVTHLIDTRIKYVEEARANGLGDDKYFEEMEKLIRSGFEALKKHSCNKNLIAKYEKLINDTF